MSNICGIAICKAEYHSTAYHMHFPTLLRSLRGPVNFTRTYTCDIGMDAKTINFIRDCELLWEVLLPDAALQISPN